MVPMNPRDTAILTFKGSDYRCIISLISKNEDIKFNAIYWFGCKKWNIIKHKNLLSHIKMCKEILMFANIEIENKKFYCKKTPIFFAGCRYWERISI